MTHVRPFASKVLLPLFRQKLLELGTGGEDRATQFIPGFALISPMTSERLYPLQQESPSSIRESELLGELPRDARLDCPRGSHLTARDCGRRLFFR